MFRRGRDKKYLISLAFLCCTSHSLANTHVDSWDDIPILITPTRMSTPLFDSPSSVTRLKGSLLTRLGISSVYDAMRLVPGMILDEQYPGLMRVGYHRQSGYFPRHMEVLNDSVPVQRAGFGGVSFGQLPTFVDELDTIEIVRGTSTVDYGANAFSAAVNLLTHDIDNMPMLDASIMGSDAANKRSSLRLSKRLDRSQFVLRYNSYTTDGFDYFDERRFQDDLFIESFSAKGLFDISPDTSFWATALLKKTRYENPATSLNFLTAVVSNDVADDRIDSQIVGLGFSHHFNGRVADQQLKVDASYSKYDRVQLKRACFPSFMLDNELRELEESPNIRLAVTDIVPGLSSAYAFGRLALNDSIVSEPSSRDNELFDSIGQRIQALSPDAVLGEVCGLMDSHFLEERYHVESTHTLSYRENFNMSTSVALIRDQVEGEVWYRTLDRESMQFANSSRLNLNDDWAFNLGFMVKVPDIEASRSYVSSRTSLNYHPDTNNGFRLFYANSQREPDVYAISRYLTVAMDYDAGTTDHLGRSRGILAWVSDAPEDLEAEQIEVWELGYTFISRKSGVQFDLKLFRERLSHLITEPYNVELDYFWITDEKGDYSGAEFEYRKSKGRLQYGLVYTYMDTESNQPDEKILFFQHTSAVYGVYALHSDLSLGLAYYGNAAGSGNAYDRYDLTLSYDKAYSKTLSFYAQLNYRRYPKRQAALDTPVVPTDAGYDDRDRLRATLGFRY